MEEKLSELKLQVDQLTEEAEYDFQKGEHYKPQVTQIIKQIDSLIENEDLEISKKHKIELYFLKGKASDILPDYSKFAEEALTKAMKLNPFHIDSLNTLGHILWKKKDFVAAKQCFETAIEKDPNNIKSLQYLSIVLRQVGDQKDKSQNVTKSLEIAKKALTFDLKNAQSWYLVGNAYLSDYFMNPKKNNNELNLALSAYNQSEKNQNRENPDLYFNRGNIHCYFEDYQLAFNDYIKANKIDQSLTNDTLKQVQQKVLKVYDLVTNKCRITQKKLQNIVKQIPIGLREQPKGFDHPLQMCTIGDLKDGINKGLILASKSLVSYTEQNTVPAGFVIVDSKLSFASLSIYNASQEIYEKIRDLTDVFIIEPEVKQINCEIEGKQISYMCIQVKDANKIYVENEKIVNQLAHSMVVNQTFEK
ncbi:unnamed protein product [Paramecium octaurelia]|uniref:Tetratricopeptide repeat protein 5 OB fold domain-containing protein n=1 Tax=Paramecium octaurelia TaxID=43137 RepID=A0A8S1UPK1_PAROT|nr:unnamed protein product [Paramecium octaurelia]